MNRYGPPRRWPPRALANEDDRNQGEKEKRMERLINIIEDAARKTRLEAPLAAFWMEWIGDVSAEIEE